MLVGLIISLCVVTLLLAISLFVIYNLLKELESVADEKEDLIRTFTEYANHLKIVYELPTFYGDEILQNLLRHTVSIQKYLKKYIDVILLLREDSEIEDIDFIDEEEYENNNEENSNSDQKEATKTGKVVFYGGA